MQNKVSHSKINTYTSWISKYNLDKAYIHETKKSVILNLYVIYTLMFRPDSASIKNKLKKFNFYQ